MPRTPIYITTAPWWQLVAAQVVALLCFLAAIIATFAGPGPYSESEVSTYDCDAGQHVWDPTRCRGYQIGTDEHREWTTDVTGTGKSSRYWGVSLRPYRKVASPPPEKDAYVKMHLTVNTTLYYYDNKKSEWVNDGPSRAHKLDFKCHSLKFQGKCEPISLAYEVSVKHKENRLVTFFESSSVLGDAVFITEKGNPSWTTLELSFTFIFLIVSIAAFVAMLVLLFRYKSRTWHFEQTASLVLIVLLVLYNNPFFAIVYLTRNLFTVILGSLFKTLFVSGLLLFWLMFSDKIHHRGAISLRSRNNILKMAVTAIFFVITIIGCIVANVEDHNNPVIGKPNEIQAVSILMGMSGFIVIVVFIWTIVLIALSFRSIVAAPLGRVRLLYFGIPTLVVILSMIFGIFSSGIGLFRNSVSNSFFCTCYNVYIYVIAFVTIPISVGDGVAGSSGSQSVSSSGNDAVSSEKSGLLGLNETKK